MTGDWYDGPVPPTAKCPRCRTVVEVEHTSVLIGNKPVRYDPIESDEDALAGHYCEPQ